jgi:hypothetical protein
MKIIIYSIIVFCNLSIAFAQIAKDVLAPKKPKNCYITVSSYLKTGETQKSTRRFFYKSKEKCEKMNRILSENFSPREVTKVKTTMEWKGE